MPSYHKIQRAINSNKWKHLDIISPFSMEMYLIEFSISALWLIISFLVCKKSKNLPPGPWKLPLIGNILQLMGDSPYRNLRDLANKYGPLVYLQLGEVPLVVVSSAEAAKDVMKTHDMTFASRPHTTLTKIMSYDSKNIGFSPYGEYLRRIRKICHLELLGANRVQSFRSVREEETLNLIRWIASNEGKSINLTDTVYTLQSSITSRAAFGMKNLEEQKVHKNTMAGLNKIATGLDLGDMYPSVKFFQWISGMKSKAERLHSQLDRIAEKIINDHMTGNTKTHEEPEDLVDVLLRHQDKHPEFHMTNEHIKGALLDIFQWGSETPASTITWAMTEMIKNPSILRRAQEEVRQVFGSIGHVDEEKFHKLKYTKSVIQETLRLHPPLPLLLPRENNQSVGIDGYHIPPKTKILVNAWAINRDPNYWQDAECFKPERFLGGSIDYRGTHFEYIPFGAGRRICPGISFGWANIELPIVNFLYYFDWDLPCGLKPEELDMNEAFGIVMKRKDDLFLIPSVRNRVSLS